MPLYGYKCEKCEQELEVLRRMSESDLPPQDYELEKDRRECEHQWKRHMSTAPTISRGWNWGSKGNWAKD